MLVRIIPSAVLSRSALCCRIIELLVWVTIAMASSLPAATAASILYVCSDREAQYVDKENKKGPTKAFVSGSIIIDTEREIASLNVASRHTEIIGTRITDKMEFFVETENGQTLLTGETADEETHFTLYTTDKMLQVAYKDIVIRIRGCVSF